ncbi:hypothetical protein LTR84_008869 [Exophiala bonariae]|uniref:Uncharacterized protein n=1 Tax=Exophiala bonariae TaxID=1690606 RepID=A0AAV9MYR8_9EURO|nr:hypothetical protein LTR84_008869 [Exophiala bonariae]
MAYKLGEQVGEASSHANHGVGSNALPRTYSFIVGDDQKFSGLRRGELSLPSTYPPPVAGGASRDTPFVRIAAAYTDDGNDDSGTRNRETKFVAYNNCSASEAFPLHAAGVELPAFPVYRPESKGGDTHKIAMDNDEILQDITILTSPIASEGIPAQGSGGNRGVASFPNFLSRLAPISLAAKQDQVEIPRNLQAGVKGQEEQYTKSSGQIKQCKSYIPTFLKPGLQAQSTDVQPRSAVKPAKGTIPTFLKPGWGEAPRKAPVPGPGKKVTPVKRVLGGGHHVNELHLVPSASKTKQPQTGHSTPDKSVGCRGVLHWKKRGPVVQGPSESTNVNSDARVLLAQSGPASMVTGSVFPPEIVVTPDPCQTAASVGNSKVSVNDLPSTLRLRHTRNAIGEKQDTNSPAYKWPLVDMTNELFLNFDPKQHVGPSSAARGLKHQEPRIVGEGFLGNDLHDEVLRELASRERKRQTPNSRPVSQAGLEVVVATAPSVSHVIVSREGLPPRESNEAHGSSVIVSAAQSSLSKVAVSKQDTDQADFSWFRFSRVDLEDPADEHCRNYRTRRREMRKAKEDAWLARDTRDHGFGGSNGNASTGHLR